MGRAHKRSREDMQVGETLGGTQPPPLNTAQQRLYESINRQRFEIRDEAILAAIASARAKHAQDVLPLDLRKQSIRSPQELALTGQHKLVLLKAMFLNQVHSQGTHGGPPTLAHYGQIIHDAVTKYFHAGLKADNKARLSEDRTKPIQTFREVVRMRIPVPEEKDFDNDQQEQHLMALFAYGYGNCFHQAEICSRIADAALLPNAVIGIGDPLEPEAPRFNHSFMVLTPTFEDAAGISSDRHSTISSFSRDWVVVDPWMKLVCRGDEYESKAHEKLGKWEGRGKVLLNHADETALAPRSEGVLATFSQGKPSSPYV